MTMIERLLISCLPPHTPAIRNDLYRSQFIGPQNGRAGIRQPLQHGRVGMAILVINP
jgi:hypothetical protein